MVKKWTVFFISCFAVAFFLSACGKDKGTKKSAGTQRNEPAVAEKAGYEELYEKNKENFKSCLAMDLEKVLTVEGLSEYTVEGKNLKAVLTTLTGKSDLQSALDDLEKSNKDLHDDIMERINLVFSIMADHKNMEPNKKYLLFESVLDALLLIEDKALSASQEKDIAAKLQKQPSANIFKGETSLNSIKNEFNGNIDSRLSKISKIISDQKDQLQKIADRVNKKDKTLQQEYKKVSDEILLMSQSLEKMACTQMIIEKSDKKGDVLVNYLQAMKLFLELEAFKDLKAEPNENLKTGPNQKRKL